MARGLLSLLAMIALFAGTNVRSADTIFRSAYHDYRLVTVTDTLVQAWSIAFLPGGDILVT